MPAPAERKATAKKGMKLRTCAGCGRPNAYWRDVNLCPICQRDPACNPSKLKWRKYGLAEMKKRRLGLVP